MSTMDGITHMIDYANYAKAMGHTAMAITDHAVVQGYPDAQALVKRLASRCFMVSSFIWWMISSITSKTQQTQY